MTGWGERGLGIDIDGILPNTSSLPGLLLFFGPADGDIPEGGFVINSAQNRRHARSV